MAAPPPSCHAPAPPIAAQRAPCALQLACSEERGTRWLPWVARRYLHWGSVGPLPCWPEATALGGQLWEALEHLAWSHLCSVLRSYRFVQLKSFQVHGQPAPRAEWMEFITGSCGNPRPRLEGCLPLPRAVWAGGRGSGLGRGSSWEARLQVGEWPYPLPRWRPGWPRVVSRRVWGSHLCGGAGQAFCKVQEAGQLPRGVARWSLQQCRPYLLGCLYVESRWCMCSKSHVVLNGAPRAPRGADLV